MFHLRQQGAAGRRQTFMTNDLVTTESNVTDEGGGREIMASRCQATSKDTQYIRNKAKLNRQTDQNNELLRQRWQQI